MRKIYFLFMLGCLGWVTEMKAQGVPMQKGDGITVVYPNPTKESVSVRLKDASSKIKFINIFSILGSQVMSVSVNASQAEINLGRLRSGKYMLQCVLSDGSTQVTQVVKQ